MKRISIFLILSIFLSFGVVFANNQSVTVDELLKNPKLNSGAREAIVQVLSDKDNKVPEITSENLEKWSTVGDAFAETIKKICHILNVEVNEFLKSDVGKIVTVVIVYKLIGAELLKVLLCYGAWLLITIVSITFFKIAFIKKKIKEKDGETKYVERVEWKTTTDRNGAMFVTVMVWLLTSLVIFVVL